MNSGGKAAGTVAIVVLLAVRGAVRGYHISQSTDKAHRAMTPQKQALAKADAIEVPEEVLQRRREKQSHRMEVLACIQRGDHEAALALLNETIEAEPEHAPWYVVRGELWEERGDHTQAIADYQAALQHDPDSPLAHRRLAWVLATSPHDDLRNGNKAVKHAVRFLELNGDQNWQGLDTAAAAFAESGNFDTAVVVQRRAINNAPEDAQAAMHKRLNGYEQNQAFRAQH